MPTKYTPMTVEDFTSTIKGKKKYKTGHAARQGLSRLKFSTSQKAEMNALIDKVYGPPPAVKGKQEAPKKRGPKPGAKAARKTAAPVAASAKSGPPKRRGRPPRNPEKTAQAVSSSRSAQTAVDTSARQGISTTTLDLAERTVQNASTALKVLNESDSSAHTPEHKTAKQRALVLMTEGLTALSKVAATLFPQKKAISAPKATAPVDTTGAESNEPVLNGHSGEAVGIEATA